MSDALIRKSTESVIDDWPNDDEMSEMCGCDHSLGQHTYGLDLAPCEHCGCADFHCPSACAHRPVGQCPNDSKPKSRISHG